MDEFTHLEHASELVTVDMELMRRLLKLAENALGNAVECLEQHDKHRGRETRKNRAIANLYISDIALCHDSISEIRAAIGWPEMADEV